MPYGRDNKDGQSFSLLLLLEADLGGKQVSNRLIGAITYLGA